MRAAIPTVRAIDAAEWDRCCPGEAEGHAYCAVCEEAPPSAFKLFAVAVFDGAALVAAAPVFQLDYDLATSLQGAPRRIADVFSRWLRLSAVSLGSPLAERCHLCFAPELDGAGRAAALAAMLAALGDHAREKRIGLVAVKDLAEADNAEFRLRALAGFTHVQSLPVAVLDLAGRTEASYLAALSASTRKDLRRKLKKSTVRVERQTSIAGIEDRIAALFEATRSSSASDYGAFEELPANYFPRIMQALGPRAFLMLYWVGEELAAFNLMLRDDTRLIDKFWGMDRDLARAHDLYFVSWMANVRFCIAEGIPLLQTGQTAYAAKVRLGSRLVRSHIWFRHRNPLLHFVLRQVARFIAFDRMDPDLKALAARRGEA